VRYQEEVKSAIDYLRLLHEALVHVGTLGWVVNKVLAVLLGLLEEALTHALVHDNQGDLGCGQPFLRAFIIAILLADDLIQLLQFEVDDLLAH